MNNLHWVTKHLKSMNHQAHSTDKFNGNIYHRSLSVSKFAGYLTFSYLKTKAILSTPVLIYASKNCTPGKFASVAISSCRKFDGSICYTLQEETLTEISFLHRIYYCRAFLLIYLIFIYFNDKLFFFFSVIFYFYSFI